MNYKQNEKIAQLTEKTLIVGVDIAKHTHVARAQDFRGIQFDKALSFENSWYGFKRLIKWIRTIQEKEQKMDLIIGMEPTGHYWLPLAYWLLVQDIHAVVVNPAHVKKAKELDDNSPTKNDVKDARVIARLIEQGRYQEPHLPKGIYAELREAMVLYDQLHKDLNAVKGRMHQWLDRYFPEYFEVFSKWEGKASLQVLDLQLFPEELAELSPEKIVEHIRREVKRGVGLKKVHLLQEAARRSIGITEGKSLARRKLGTLLRQYHFLKEEMEALWEQVEEMLWKIPGAKEMAAMHGIGEVTVAGFYAEVGDLRTYKSPEQIVKLAGLNLKLATSGKWKGQTVITKRGRPKLRSLLYKVILVLVSRNQAFKALHKYLTTRDVNPLKKKQSLVALCCKLIRILFVVGKKQKAFSEEKMLKDIPHFRQQEAA